ncbi:MAG: FkbM family methyltransferase, partial [Candidatus Hydrogenedentota bacterium]
WSFMKESSMKNETPADMDSDPGTMRRYLNLIGSVSNWPTYFSTKISKNRGAIHRFRDRSNKIQLEVPRSLLGTFKEIYLGDIYAMKTLCDALPKDSNVIDVGANVGIFSLRLLALKPDATVVAYEPLPSNFEMLQRNAEINPQIVDNFRVFQRAVTGGSESEQTIYFNPEKSFTPTASLIESFDTSNRGSIQVKTDSLDSIVTEHSMERIHLLKLDCEGSEFDILDGASPELIARIAAIVMEVHESGENTIERMKDSLETMGFSVTDRVIDDGVALMRAFRPKASV